MHVEIGNRAIQPGIQRIGVGGRARSEAGRKINSLTESVAPRKANPLLNLLFHGQLELIRYPKDRC